MNIFIFKIKIWKDVDRPELILDLKNAKTDKNPKAFRPTKWIKVEPKRHQRKIPLSEAESIRKHMGYQLLNWTSMDDRRIEYENELDEFWTNRERYYKSRGECVKKKTCLIRGKLKLFPTTQYEQQ